MPTRRMFPPLIAAFLASALLAIMSSAPFAYARSDSGAVRDWSAVSNQEEPSCEERCERHADEVFLACRARGASIEDCAGEARNALAECLEDCDRPEEPTCLDRCREHATEVEHACLERGGGPDLCENEGREAYTACVKEKCEPEDPPAEPGCADRCEERAREVKHACLEGGGSEEECARQARAAFEDCVEHCDKPVDPPEEPTCEDRCEENAKVIRDACIERGGGEDACHREFLDAYEACVKVNCRPDEPPREPGCVDRCEEEARAVKVACRERGGTEEECATAAREAFETCTAHCDKPEDPPKEPTCEGLCEKHATEVRNACLERGGGPDLCESEGLKAYEDCLAEKCKREEPPKEPGCEDRCEVRAREVKHACLERGGSEEECAREFTAAFRACVAEKCERPDPRPPVDPPSCEKRCQARWEEVFRRCIADGRGEDDCRAAANTERDACVHACDRRPDPEPPSCDERCARYRAAVLKACLETGAGEEFCVHEAGQAQERCIVQCTRPTVISPGRSCESICTQLGRLTYRRCISGGGGPEDCLAKARATIERCAKRCDRPDPGGRGVIPVGP